MAQALLGPWPLWTMKCCLLWSWVGLWAASDPSMVPNLSTPSPSLQVALRAAEVEAGLSEHPPDMAWVRRGRWRGWLPVLTGRVGTDLDRRLLAVGDVREDRALEVQVRARWDLREWAFHRSEVAAQRERRAWIRERSSVRRTVTRLYAAWRRALHAAHQHPGPETRAALEVRAIELSAWTGLSIPGAGSERQRPLRRSGP